MKKFILFCTATLVAIICSVAIYYYFASTKANATKATNINHGELFQEVTATQAAKNLQETTELKVTIASPKKPISLTQNPSVKIAGATKRNSMLAITGGKTTIIRAVNADGSFAPDVELLEGVNNLTLSLFDSNGIKAETTRTVIYLKDKLDTEATITDGLFSMEEDTPYLIKNENPTEIKTNKQTKLYHITDGTKKTIRSLTQLTPEVPTYVISDTEVALAVVQQDENATNNVIAYGKVSDKSVEDENFRIELENTVTKDKKEFVVDAKTTIKSTATDNTQLRGSDIKIDDKIIIVTPNPEENTAIQVLIIPGQAAGILKDVKQN